MKGSTKLIFKCAFVLLCSMLASCRKKVNSRTDLIAYINDTSNGLIKVQEAGKIKAVLTYKPLALVVKSLVKPTKQINAGAMNDKLFFVLSLSANNKEVLQQLPANEYSEMVQVLAFRMRTFIDLVPDDSKPLTAEDCMFQQTYGLGYANQLLIVFDKAKLKTAKQLNIKVKEFGLNTGDLNFQFNAKDINDTPTIGVN